MSIVVDRILPLQPEPANGTMFLLLLLPERRKLIGEGFIPSFHLRHYTRLALPSYNVEVRHRIAVHDATKTLQCRYIRMNKAKT